MKSAIMLLAALALAAPARAAVTAEDVQVAGRVLAFTATPLSGNVRLGIVYDPGNAASAADERALLGILGGGMQVGAVNLVPVPIPLGKLANTPADVLFLTAGLGPSAAAARTAADAQQIMCITTDLAATQAGNCAVAVQSEPKVSITVNKAAAAAANVSFGTAFMLMITQI